MAERGCEGDGGFTSTTVDSEIVFDFFCELCKDDDVFVEAEGFCIDCSEYLCEICFKAHSRSRPTRYHDLLDKNAMPKDTPLEHDRLNRAIPTKCKLHPGKTVEFYCRSHNCLGCSTCFATVHRNCPTTEIILEESDHILDSSDYKNIRLKLQELQTKSREMITRSRENKRLSERCCSEAVAAVRKVKDDVIEIFSELEQKIVAQAEQIMSEDTNKLVTQEENYSALAEMVDKISSEFELLQTGKRVCQLYIKMKESESEIKALAQSFDRATRNNTVRRFTFEPNGELETYLRTSNALGKLSVQQCTGTRPETSKDPMHTAVTHVANICVSVMGDKSKCSITGATLVSALCLVVTDHGNCEVKLVGTCSFKLQSVLKVSSNPWDCTTINSDQAAVTLPDSKKILLLRVNYMTDSLTIEREITVGGNCHGVAYNQNRLLVSFTDNPRLEIIDLHGNVIKRIANDSDGSKLFSLPKYVCTSNTDATIYVSDAGRCALTSLTFDGVLKSVHKNVELRRPQKVCTDNHGNVYVCDFESRTIHMITADRNISTKILKQSDGLDGGVWSVSHCQDTDRLYVGMNGANIIKVFQLT